MKTQRDETLQEIWAIRRRIAKKFGFDPKKTDRLLSAEAEATRRENLPT
jgi:hypothetical protein